MLGKTVSDIKKWLKPYLGAYRANFRVLFIVVDYSIHTIDKLYTGIVLKLVESREVTSQDDGIFSLAVFIKKYCSSVFYF